MTRAETIKARDQRLVRRYVEDETVTVASLAEELKITDERVRQILDMHGIPRRGVRRCIAEAAPQVCPQCGAEFRPKRANVVFCGEACEGAASRARVAARFERQHPARIGPQGHWERYDPFVQRRIRLVRSLAFAAVGPDRIGTLHVVAFDGNPDNAAIENIALTRNGHSRAGVARLIDKFPGASVPDPFAGIPEARPLAPWELAEFRSLVARVGIKRASRILRLPTFSDARRLVESDLVRLPRLVALRAAVAPDTDPLTLESVVRDYGLSEAEVHDLTGVLRAGSFRSPHGRKHLERLRALLDRIRAQQQPHRPVETCAVAASGAALVRHLLDGLKAAAEPFAREGYARLASDVEELFTQVGIR